MYLLVGGETHIIVHTWRPETICRCRFSLPTMWVPEIELWGSVLEVSTITCYVISLALNLIVCVCARTYVHVQVNASTGVQGRQRHSVS